MIEGPDYFLGRPKGDTARMFSITLSGAHSQHGVPARLLPTFRQLGFVQWFLPLLIVSTDLPAHGNPTANTHVPRPFGAMLSPGHARLQLCTGVLGFIHPEIGTVLLDFAMIGQDNSWQR